MKNPSQKHRSLPMGIYYCYWLIRLSFLALVLAACSPAASEPAATVAPTITAVETSLAAVTPTAEPTPTPTEIPDSEVSFDQLVQIDSSWGEFVQAEDGSLIYNSSLNSEVGKNVPMIQQYRETGLDGGAEVWVAPEKYPNAPLFIQDVDTGEIRQGPFRYDDDVRRRLTMPSSGSLYKSPITEGLEATQPALNFVETMNFNGLDLFAISVLSRGDILERDGHLLMPVKSYVGDEKDHLAFYYNLALGPTDPENGHWNPFYDTYRNGSLHSYYLEHIINGAGDFSGKIGYSEQMVITGVYSFSSRESIPQNFYSSNYYYAYEHMEESRLVISILQSAGFPSDSSGGDSETPLLFGTVRFIPR